MSDIGCVTNWEVRIVDRFTGTALDLPAAARISGSRVADAISTATAEFPKAGGIACCAQRPKRSTEPFWMPMP